MIAKFRPAFHDLRPRQPFPFTEIEFTNARIDVYLEPVWLGDDACRLNCALQIACIYCIELVAFQCGAQGPCLKTAHLGERNVAAALIATRSIPFGLPVPYEDDFYVGFLVCLQRLACGVDEQRSKMIVDAFVEHA